MGEHEDLQALWRAAKPEDLASLRSLDAALVRSGFRVEGKSVREWIADFPARRARWFDGGEAVGHVCEAGLAAVPALVDALRSKRPDLPAKADTSLRAQCIEALERITPPPTCAVPALLEALRLPGARVRRMALVVLAKLRPRPTAAVLRAVLPCLRDKQDSQLRGRAARLLARLEGPLPAEVRDAALERLGDPVRFVRRYALGVLGRFPGDTGVLTALEEQALLDDDNRLEALRVLTELAPERGIAGLLDTARKAAADRPEASNMRGLEAALQEGSHREPGMRALLLLGRMGARAVSALPALRELTWAWKLAPYADAAIDDITRDVLRRRAPPLPPERFHEPRVAALLRDLPPPREPSEEPSRVLARWAAGLRDFGPELTVRVALAAARRVLWLWEYQDPNNSSPRASVMAMDRWVCEPTEAHAGSALDSGNFVPSQVASSPDAFSASWSVTYATLCLPGAAKEPLLAEEDGGHLGACVHAACRALSRQSVITWSFGHSEESPEPLTPLEAAREMRQAILDEVLPWACGTWDPVRDVPPLRAGLLGSGAPG